MKKYLEELVPGGYVSRCVPLVIEHFGRWGTKAENFLQHLSQQSANPEANFNAFMFMSYWRKKIFYNSAKMPKLSLENFQNFHLIMVI